MTTPTKILLIGIDGGTFQILQSGITAGKLPTFEKLVKEGVSGTLTSTIPPATIPAFPTLMTGKNPGKHGIFDFMMRDGDRIVLVDGTKISGITLWRILSDHRKKCIAVNIPLTYPPEEIDGVIVSGMMTPSGQDFTHPKELGKELDKLVDGYPVKFLPFFEEVGRTAFVQALHTMIDKRHKAVQYLMKKWEWELFAVLFRATDIVSHHLWNSQKDVLSIYQHCDRVIGEIISQNPEAYVFIFSDHGFGSYLKSFNVNVFLKSLHLLKVMQKTKGNQSQPSSSQRRIVKSFSRIGLYRSRIRNLIPAPLFRLLRRFMGGQIRKYIPATHLAVDTEKSKAYFSKTVTAETQSITINASSQQEYDKLVKMIIDKLEALVDPETGVKVVKRAFHRSELYTGPYADRAPDIIMMLNAGYKGTTTLSGRHIIEKLPQPKGTHSIDGVFLAKGPHVKRGAKISQITLQDLGPTLLHLIELPIPEDVDGKVKKEIFIPKSPPRLREPLFYTPKLKSREAKPLSTEEEEEVLDRLRDLGYLD